MTGNPAQNYLRTKVLTATPEQLQLMLYDGAIRFADQARVAMDAKNFDQSYTLLTKSQKIILELQCGLKHDVSPDLCGKLAALYNFVFRKLVEANTHHTTAPIDEALQILNYQRETWSMLLQQLAQSKAAVMARKIDMPAPSSRMEASISLQG
jgi:flagellar secretion chaperone FliS